MSSLSSSSPMSMSIPLKLPGESGSTPPRRLLIASWILPSRITLPPTLLWMRTAVPHLPFNQCSQRQCQCCIQRRTTIRQPLSPPRVRAILLLRTQPNKVRVRRWLPYCHHISVLPPPTTTIPHTVRKFLKWSDRYPVFPPHHQIAGIRVGRVNLGQNHNFCSVTNSLNYAKSTGLKWFRLFFILRHLSDLTFVVAITYLYIVASLGIRENSSREGT